MRLLGKTVRARLLASVAAGVLGCSAGLAQAQDREPITIAPQALESALYDFGGKTGLQVLFPPGLTVSKRTSGISGIVPLLPQWSGCAYSSGRVRRV